MLDNNFSLDDGDFDRLFAGNSADFAEDGDTSGDNNSPTLSAQSAETEDVMIHRTDSDGASQFDPKMLQAIFVDPETLEEWLNDVGMDAQSSFTAEFREFFAIASDYAARYAAARRARRVPGELASYARIAALSTVTRAASIQVALDIISRLKISDCSLETPGAAGFSMATDVGDLLDAIESAQRGAAGESFTFSAKTPWMIALQNAENDSPPDLIGLIKDAAVDPSKLACAFGVIVHSHNEQDTRGGAALIAITPDCGVFGVQITPRPDGASEMIFLDRAVLTDKFRAQIVYCMSALYGYSEARDGIEGAILGALEGAVGAALKDDPALRDQFEKLAREAGLGDDPDVRKMLDQARAQDQDVPKLIWPAGLNVRGKYSDN